MMNFCDDINCFIAENNEFHAKPIPVFFSFYKRETRDIGPCFRTIISFHWFLSYETQINFRTLKKSFIKWVFYVWIKEGNSQQFTRQIRLWILDVIIWTIKYYKLIKNSLCFTFFNLNIFPYLVLWILVYKRHRPFYKPSGKAREYIVKLHVFLFWLYKYNTKKPR